MEYMMELVGSRGAEPSMIMDQRRSARRAQKLKKNYKMTRAREMRREKKGKWRKREKKLVSVRKIHFLIIFGIFSFCFSSSFRFLLSFQLIFFSAILHIDHFFPACRHRITSQWGAVPFHGRTFVGEMADINYGEKKFEPKICHYRGTHLPAGEFDGNLSNLSYAYWYP